MGVKCERNKSGKWWVFMLMQRSGRGAGALIDFSADRLFGAPGEKGGALPSEAAKPGIGKVLEVMKLMVAIRVHKPHAAHIGPRPVQGRPTDLRCGLVRTRCAVRTPVWGSFRSTHVAVPAACRPVPLAVVLGPRYHSQ